MTTLGNVTFQRLPSPTSPTSPSSFPEGFDDSRPCYWRDADGLWMCYMPGFGAANLSNHTVVEHEDGTITVTPSILMNWRQGKTPVHGYLTCGVWRDC